MLFSTCLQGMLGEVRGAWQATGRQLELRSAAEAAAVGGALAQLREDLAAALPAGKLRGVEAKLAALEGSVLSAGAASPTSSFLASSSLKRLPRPLQYCRHANITLPSLCGVGTARLVQVHHCSYRLAVRLPAPATSMQGTTPGRGGHVGCQWCTVS